MQSRKGEGATEEAEGLQTRRRWLEGGTEEAEAAEEEEEVATEQEGGGGEEKGRKVWSTVEGYGGGG